VKESVGFQASHGESQEYFRQLRIERILGLITLGALLIGADIVCFVVDGIAFGLLVIGITLSFVAGLQIVAANYRECPGCEQKLPIWLMRRRDECPSCHTIWRPTKNWSPKLD
jgi:hypothetical protein